MATLITGGTGFIGSQLARLLLQAGRDVVLFDLYPRLHAIRDIEGRVKVVRGDLANFAEVLGVVQGHGVDTIFHLGAMVSMPSEANPQASYAVNVNGTFHVLEAARLFAVRQVLFTSSIATYGEGLRPPITDETVQRPTIMYGAAKVFGELLGRFYARRYGIDFRGVRFPAIVGPGVKAESVVAYNALMIEKAALGEAYEVPVPEETRVAILYVKDAARSLFDLAGADRGRIRTMVYTLAGITPVPRAGQLAAAIRKVVPGARVAFKPEPAIMEVIQRVTWEGFDDSRARQEWGWRVEYGLDETVADSCRELSTNPALYR